MKSIPSANIVAKDYDIKRRIDKTVNPIIKAITIEIKRSKKDKTSISVPLLQEYYSPFCAISTEKFTKIVIAYIVESLKDKGYLVNIKNNGSQSSLEISWQNQFEAYDISTYEKIIEEVTEKLKKM
jgi:hypothetical protein